MKDVFKLIIIVPFILAVVGMLILICLIHGKPLEKVWIGRKFEIKYR